VHTLNYTDRKSYQGSLQEFCLSIHPTHFVTIGFHNRDPLSTSWAEPRLRHFDAMLDRYWLGPKWASMPSPSRTHFVGVPEGHPAGRGVLDLHYHLLLAPAAAAKRKVNGPCIESIGREFLLKCAPGGSIDVKSLPTEIDGRRASSYAVKDIWDPACPGIEGWVVAPWPKGMATTLPYFVHTA
jgi:hypothetical protein